MMHAPDMRRPPAPAPPARHAEQAPPAVHDVLRSPGKPLDPAVRREMEPRFGQSFAGVRVHDDSRAADSAASVGAQAYTVGMQLVFGAQRFQPASQGGKRLLAHELAHVVQQGGGEAKGGAQPAAGGGE